MMKIPRIPRDWSLGIENDLGFGLKIVSDFDIRISDLRRKG
jgi:hypothetical protein